MSMTLNGLTYELNSQTKTAVLTSCDLSLTGDVVIPEIVNYDGVEYSVVDIEWNVFSAHNEKRNLDYNEEDKKVCHPSVKVYPHITSITIPGSIKYLGGTITQFPICRDNPSLRSVIIQEGVHRVAEQAFYKCTNLKEISIPASVTSISASSFYGTAWWEENSHNGEVYINDILVRAKDRDEDFVGEIRNGCKIIGPDAFRRYSSMVAVSIPDTVTMINGCAFDGCEKLSTLTIPDSVTYIGGAAFMYAGLHSIHLPQHLTTITNSLFYACSNLSSISIPQGVKTIERSAFKGCHGLVSVEFPNSIETIGEHAFYHCESLTSISIPSGVTCIESMTFYGCSALKSVDIPNTVTSIKSGAFYGCICLSSIYIPSSVTEIRNGAFYDCSSLTSIVIPNGVTEICQKVFCNCTGLTSIVIPEGVTKIGYGAFSGCSQLTEIFLPSSIEHVDAAAFFTGAANTIFHVPSEKKDYFIKMLNKVAMDGFKIEVEGETTNSADGSDSDSSENSASFDIKDNVLLKCVSQDSLVRLPNCVEKIASDAFRLCPHLREIASEECKYINIVQYIGLSINWMRSLLSHYTLDDLFLSHDMTKFSLWIWDENLNEENSLDGLVQNYHPFESWMSWLGGWSFSSIEEFQKFPETWRKTQTIDMNDLVSHSIDESVLSQLPLVGGTPHGWLIKSSGRTTPFVDKPWKNFDELGCGILYIKGLDKTTYFKMMQSKFPYERIAEKHELPGYGMISPNWLIVVGISVEAQLHFRYYPYRFAQWCTWQEYDTMELSQYLERKREQGNLIEIESDK